MKSLKDFYEENGITTPKNLLEREEWLYSKMSEDTSLVVQGIENQTNELIIATEKIETLERKLQKDYIRYWAYGGVITGIVVAFFVSLCIASNSDDLNQLRKENSQLKDTATWIQKNNHLESENAALKSQLDQKRWNIQLERLLLVAGGATGATVVAVILILGLTAKR